MKKIISITMVITMLLSLFTVTASAATEWKTGNIVNHGSSCGYTTIYLTNPNKSGKFTIYAYNSSGGKVTSSNTMHVTITDYKGNTVTTYDNVTNGKTITLSNKYDTYRIYVRKSFTHTFNPTRNSKKIVKSWGLKTGSNTTFNYENSYSYQVVKEMQNSSSKKTTTSTTTNKNTSNKLYENESYIISPKHAPNSVVDTSGGNSSKYEGANIVLWQHGRSVVPSRQFKFISVGGGWYKIINVNSGLALDVNCSNCNVALYKYHGGINQHWKLEDAGNGYYYIRTRVTDGNGTAYYLDVHGGNTGDGTNIEVYPFNGGNNQRFSLTKLFS